MPTKIPWVTTDDGRGGRKAEASETIDPAYLPSSSGTGVTDGDKGDIVISGTGTVYTIDSSAVTTTKINDLAVTSGKINTGAVVEAKLGTGAVTDPKVSGGISATKISGGDVTNAMFDRLFGVTDDIQAQFNLRPRTIFSRSTDTGIVTTGAYETAWTDTIPAGTMTGTGWVQGVYITGTAANANSKRTRLLINSTQVALVLDTNNSGQHELQFMFMRRSDTELRTHVMIRSYDASTGTLLSNYSNFSDVTVSNMTSNAVSVVLQMRQTVFGDITAKMATCTYHPTP